MTMILVSNRYRVVRELGKGGFGTTSLVEDTQLPSGRRCVLKELLPVESSAEIYTLVKQRFEREAVILEELGNLTLQIPSLYAYFAENNKFYLVQEYVEGETIAQRVQSQGVMSDAAVREWVMGLLPVLAVVHDRKIIHRDIKPENVILRQRDHKPVLIDFGAVRETMGTLINPSGQSTQSIVIGTPGFMASEQAAGRAVFASDLYSLGLTAIYALTGKMPQELPTDPMTGNVQWRQYAPSVSAGLSAVIDRAIAPVSRDRFQTSGQMLDELIRSDSPTGMPGTTISMSPGFTNQTTPPNNSNSGSGNSGNYQPTVIAAHGNPYPAQQPMYQQPMQQMYQQPVPTSNNDSKTWIMALGVGAMVTLAGVGVMAMIKDKDKPAPVAAVPAAPASTSAGPAVTINNGTESRKEPETVRSEPNSSGSSSQPTSSTATSSNIPSFSSADARSLLVKWMSAKKKVFAAPFDSQAASVYTTGKLYSDITKPEGSIDWLRGNNSYYIFSSQSVDSISNFSSSGDTATAIVDLTEDITMYKNGRVDPSQTSYKSRSSTYQFQYIDGTWKIADYKKIE